MISLTQHWAGRPLAILPSALPALLHTNTLAPASPDASRFVGTRARNEAARVTEGGVAVVTIDGPLINRGQILGENWGLNSYEGLAFKLYTIARDPKISSIILDIESPGGEAAGCFELASLVRDINKEKPIYAVVDAIAASAAYAIASGARAIISTPSGLSGSIGVVLAHFDISRAVDQAGITPTLIFAGDRKTDGTPLAPLPDEVRDDLQRDVDKFYTMFLETVAAGRGQRLTAKSARETEARTYIGKDAVAAGLADDVGTFAEFLASLEKTGAPSPKGKSNMRTEIESNPTMKAEYDAGFAEGYAEAFEEARKTGHTEGVAKSAREYRERVRTIIESVAAKGREKAAWHVALETELSAEDAIAALRTMTSPTLSIAERQAAAIIRQ